MYVSYFAPLQFFTEFLFAGFDNGCHRFSLFNQVGFWSECFCSTYRGKINSSHTFEEQNMTIASYMKKPHCRYIALSSKHFTFYRTGKSSNAMCF